MKDKDIKFIGFIGIAISIFIISPKDIDPIYFFGLLMFAVGAYFIFRPYSD